MIISETKIKKQNRRNRHTLPGSAAPNVIVMAYQQITQLHWA